MEHTVYGKSVQCKQSTYLCHYHILALLHVFSICFYDCLQEPQVLHVAAVCLNAVHKMLHDSLADLIAQVVIVHEDVPQSLRFQQLGREDHALIIMMSSTFLFYRTRIKCPGCNQLYKFIQSRTEFICACLPQNTVRSLIMNRNLTRQGT